MKTYELIGTLSIDSELDTTGKLIERAVVECNGDHRALFTYVRNIWNAYVLEMTYARRG